MKAIDIVITTWGREWMTDLCIKAIKMNTKTPHRIIIVDNGSQLIGQMRYLASSDVYLKLDKNHGLEYAKHIAMEFVESNLFISMDNDILVYKYEDKDWLQRILDLMEKYSNYAAIACKPQILVGTGMAMFETEREIVPFPHVPGYARIMKTAFTKKVGAWDALRPSRGHEELWFGEKAKYYNLKTGWANFVEVYHLWGKEGQDGWGYEQGVDSGHTPVWPMPKNDAKLIKEKVGVSI